MTGAWVGFRTHLRPDTFDNGCSADTAYAVKAYALCKTAADAAIFIHCDGRAESDGAESEDTLRSVDFDAFRVEAAVG